MAPLELGRGRVGWRNDIYTFRYVVHLEFSVSPGNIWTPLWDEFASAEVDKESAIKSGEKAQVGRNL